MQEKDLKTSPKQRIFIAIIAALMLGASVAVYIAIILSANSSSGSDLSAVDEELIAELESAYSAKNEEYESAANALSSKYLESFVGYRSNVKGFNATAANEKSTVETEDLKIGDGEKLDVTSAGYGAYYIGWCADETVFDSSFDNYDSPTKLNAPLVVERDYLIEGWYIGVSGMRLGGARIVTIPGELAYGDSQEICGGTNSPLRFLIMPVAIDESFVQLSDEMSELYMKLLYAQYGIQYTGEE
ncbi:FKBP-type peptidyl-prolyl cis-trans isomerase [Candidatus Saccharibacteria bacterium]|nr:FKBP-type peptidyl-prolyl cis-trans isomerase [Candidatus Saccharibacteria bacterium]